MTSARYERMVASPVGDLGRLSAAVISDLNPERGGVEWWDGQVDFKRRVVLSEYLLDSLNGAAESLTTAAFAAQEHREAHFADDQWLLSQWRTVAKTSHATDDDYLAAARRNGFERRRELKITASAGQAIGQTMRVLDCLAAAIIIVGAIPEGVRRTDWREVESLAERAAKRSVTTKLDPLGTRGRELQDELLKAALTWQQHGPTDWLPWLRATRNSLTHRATRIDWHLLHGKKSQIEGLLRPHPRQPDSTDMEILGLSRTGSISELRLMKRSPDMIDGLVNSMTDFASVLAQALARCWEVRRRDPAVLCQRGAQWQELQGSQDYAFPGYGDDAHVIGRKMYVGEDLAKRLDSAQVSDHVRHRWDG